MLTRMPSNWFRPYWRCQAVNWPAIMSIVASGSRGVRNDSVSTVLPSPAVHDSANAYADAFQLVPAVLALPGSELAGDHVDSRFRISGRAQRQRLNDPSPHRANAELRFPTMDIHAHRETVL